MSSDRQVKHVTCLGCGCGCDDVTVTIRDGRIAAADPTCPLGAAWFGSGEVPLEVLHRGEPTSLERAISAAAAELVGAHGRCLVYLGLDLTSEAQRAGLAIADLLRAVVDVSTSETAANGVLTAQRRGRAGATLGEIRNRADTLLFWGVDPAQRYPRFLERYAVQPTGTHVPDGRRGRTVIGVSVGADRAVTEADLHIEIAPEQEIEALSLMRLAVLGRALPTSSPVLNVATELANQLTRARYAVVIHDAEPTAERRNPLRAEALITLTQALNGPTRAALCSLRAGHNSVGAESVLTWQTGFPFAVDYSRGFPRYTPGERGLNRITGGGLHAALLVGSMPRSGIASLADMRTVVIGPRASQSAFDPIVAIDTGVAGVHESGTAYRMDEVPLRLRPPLEGARPATPVLMTLHEVVRRKTAETLGMNP
ncbi:MAG TPA: hypothetical protein VHH32_08680 [Gemmatimonadales bacterium]|nr:hypothetical protein [Gemmatimonadales bacterium]